MDDSCIIWYISDGKTGHVNQMRGLVAALRERIKLATHLVEAPSRWRSALDCLQARYPLGDKLPNPDLILCAGSSTHLSALAARRARGGRLVVMMTPSLPIAWFDLCVIPEFGGVPAGPRVILTRGPLSEVKFSPNSAEDRGLILVGGPSRHHDWSDDLVLEQIGAVVTRDGGVRWRVLTSRRTPLSMEQRLRALSHENVELVPVTEAPPGTVPRYLAEASKVWVTKESVSMTYESLTAGAGVGLIHLPHRKRNRAFKGIQRLIDDGSVTTFEAWQAGQPLVRSRAFPNEAGRCADEVLQRLPDLDRFRLDARHARSDYPVGQRKAS